MKLSSEELIEEFYQQEKSKYPGLTKQQFKDICFGPWEFFKEEMKSGELPEIRFKYFGVFKVYEGRAKNLLNTLEKNFKENKITDKRYTRIKTMITNFLNNGKD